jgi:hypothetical protein
MGGSFHYIVFWHPTAENQGDFAREISKMTLFSSELRKMG